jgi:hypothetical protein
MKRKELPFIVILAVVLLVCSFASSLEIANATPNRYISAFLPERSGTEGATAFYLYPENLVGGSDDEFAYLHTETFWGDYQGDEAILTGEMNDWAFGEVYIQCFGYTPPGSPECSRLFVFTSDDPSTPYLEWEQIGVETGTEISWNDPQLVYIGIATSPFKYISITVWAASVDFAWNSVWVDSVSAEPYDPFIPPPWPIFHTIAVNVCDNYGNPLAGDIYIDGDYAGQTSVTQLVCDSTWWGPHEISVDDVAGYAFQYFTINGDTDFSNPMSLEVYEPVTITAYFGPPPPPAVYHSVTVDCYAENEDPYFNPDYYCALRVDGAWGYPLAWPFSLVEGTHTFTVDEIINCNYCYYEFLYFTCDGNTYYSNSIALPITSDKTITAHYYLYWGY